MQNVAAIKKNNELAINVLTADELEQVTAIMLEAAGSKVDLIPEIAEHILQAGGKRLRPILTIACSHLAGYQGSNHFYLAAAVEFLHTASLLHDDVVDESKLRRGRPTANAIWDNKASVLVGDFVNTQAFNMMLKTRSLAALDVLATTARDIAEGEVMQLVESADIALSEENYRKIIAAKTAALFAAACELGAVAADKENLRRNLRDFGWHLGMAFQMADDALDYAGVGAKMGKNVGTDFYEGKVTLPVILAYQAADASGRALLENLFVPDAARNEADLQQVAAIIEKTGALHKVLHKAAAESALAVAAISQLPASPYHAALVEVAEFAAARNF